MIDTVPLMEMLQCELVELLEALQPEQWTAATACAGWTVKDVVAHLLDGNLRRLSICRDRHKVAFTRGDLGAWLNELNASWVDAARRLSPRLLVDLHKLVGPQVIEFWRGLDPHAEAFFPVAWAGESRSEMWFDCARDFTEQWHHQQQIREAAACASLITPNYFPAVLSILMRCVPAGYRDVDAPEHTTVRITAEGDAGAVWTLTRTRSHWTLEQRECALPDSTIEMPQRDVWLLFTKKLSPAEAERRASVNGDERLARAFFRCRAVMG